MKSRPIAVIAAVVTALSVSVVAQSASAAGLKGFRPPDSVLVNPAAPGTSVRPSESQQVMVADRTTGTYGTYVRYEWQGPERGWVIAGKAGARFGYAGMSDPNRRREGDGTTPTGKYRIVDTFGVGNPGTRMHYRTINDCSWWSDKRDATYNRFVQQCGWGHGEQLTRWTKNAEKQYLQTAVLDFLWNRQSEHRGSAIFLHYSTGSTAGCIGVTDRAEMNNTIRWLDPAKNPTIVVQS